MNLLGCISRDVAAVGAGATGSASLNFCTADPEGLDTGEAALSSVTRVGIVSGLE